MPAYGGRDLIRHRKVNKAEVECRRFIMFVDTPPPLRLFSPYMFFQLQHEHKIEPTLTLQFLSLYS